MITDAQSITTIYNGTNHDHLYFSSSRSVFANNIIEENDFCQLHGQVIFITARKKIKGYSDLVCPATSCSGKAQNQSKLDLSGLNRLFFAFFKKHFLVNDT